MKPMMSRRQVLRASAKGVAALVALDILTACGGSGTTASPTAAGSAPTKAAASPAAAASDDQKIGKSLIGNLEGPEVVTDPAQFPKTFSESPLLTDMVKAGKLPPVAERVGQDPLVIKPLKEVGQYGGTWRRGFTGPGDKFNGWRVATGTDSFLYYDYTGQKVVPNIAKAWEIGDGGRSITLRLRRGMKWSDGEPFNADDVMFWYDDMHNNEELTPTKPSAMSINGKQGKVEKVDAYTVVFRFPDPYYLILDVLAGHTALGGHASHGLDGQGGVAPAHYLKQFHPKYTAKAELDKKVADAKLDNWVLLFQQKNDWALNPDLPVVTPWKTTSPINTPTWTLERNPYSIWVDTQGNQLPYIDKVVMTVGENLEIINLRAIAGEYDFQARHMDIAKLPVLLQNQQKGGYKVYLDTGDYGSDMVLMWNLSYEKDPEIAKWIGNPDFRRALSIGIDRDQLNETFWLGTGTPGSAAPRESNLYSPGPEYRTMWAAYDVKKANDMLDKIGLMKKDNEGFRLRSDGQSRLRIEAITYAGQFLPYPQITEVIGQQLKKIGIDLSVQAVERSLGDKQIRANEHQMFAWTGDGSEHLFTFPGNVFPSDGGSGNGPLFGQWFQSRGTKGKEPPLRMKEIMEKFRKAFGVPPEEQIQMGKEVWKTIIEDVNVIGIVGLAAASMGVRVVKTNMGNIPARQFNSPVVKTPSISRPMTFYFKK